MSLVAAFSQTQRTAGESEVLESGVFWSYEESLQMKWAQISINKYHKNVE